MGTYAFPYGHAPTVAWASFDAPHGVYYASAAPIVKVTPFQQTVTRIEVRDYYDNLIVNESAASGKVMSGDDYISRGGPSPAPQYTIPTPDGGWRPGYYKLYQFDDNAAHNQLTVAHKQLTSNVATLDVGSHNYLVGDYIDVEGVGTPFDGQYIITAKDATHISYAVTHADVTLTSATGTAIAASKSWRGGISVGVSNFCVLPIHVPAYPDLTTDHGAGPADWTTVVTGDPDLTAFLNTNAPNGIGIGGASSDLKTRAAMGCGAPRLVIGSATDPYGGVRNVTTKSLTSNVATLTVSNNHKWIVGTALYVTGVGAPFDGWHTISAITANTLSFPVTNANIASTSSGGQIQSPQADTIGMAKIAAKISKDVYGVDSSSPFYDSVRAGFRDLWVSFPNLSVDFTYVGDSTNAALVVKFDATADGSTFKLVMENGTTGGTHRLRITNASGSSNLETYDNIAAYADLVTATNSSAYIRIINYVGTGLGISASPVSIPNDAFNGVKTVVQELYPVGIKYYEGPINEPQINQPSSAWMWKLFNQAVKAGNSSAKVMGPSFVSLAGNAMGGWSDSTNNVARTWFGKWLDQGLASWVDVWTTHTYHAQDGGDINLGRTQIQGWFDVLNHYGVNNRPVWVTEGINPEHWIYGIYSTRAGRSMMLQTLLWEQFGVPHEHATPWYDVSHGYWSYPAWLINGDGSLEPEAHMMRLFHQLTSGTLFNSAVDFGPIGNRLFIGSTYRPPSGGTFEILVMMAQSPMSQADGGLGASVTIRIPGYDTSNAIPWVDAFGNQQFIAADLDGTYKLPINDTPTYVGIPIGTSAFQVVTCNGWPKNMAALTNNGLKSTVGVIPSGGSSSKINVNALNDGLFEDYAVLQSTPQTTVYRSDPGNLGTTLPDYIQFTWPDFTRVDHVIIWCGNVSLDQHAINDFDVQTSMDGTTWTTKASITKVGSARQSPSDTGNHGCKYETYWDRQWIYDVKLSEPTYAKYVRIYVRNASWGYLPDSTPIHFLDSATGPFKPSIDIQEVMILCDANAELVYVTKPPPGGVSIVYPSDSTIPSTDTYMGS